MFYLIKVCLNEINFEPSSQQVNIEIRTVKNQSESKINDKDKNGKNHRFLFPPLPPNAGDLALS
jgi:hypothetical protein